MKKPNLDNLGIYCLDVAEYSDDTNVDIVDECYYWDQVVLMVKDGVLPPLAGTCRLVISGSCPLTACSLFPSSFLSVFGVCSSLLPIWSPTPP